MKLRKSEYQMSFTRMTDQLCREAHETSVAYRRQRRQQEHHHSPVAWDTDSEDEVTNKSENVEHTTTESCRNNSPRSEKPKETLQNDNAVEETIVASCPIPSSDGNLVKRNDNKVKSIKQRRKKAKNIPQIDHVIKPPFVSYGWANKENDLTRKLTHNVKAQTKFVYPAALQKEKRIKSDRSVARKQAVKKNAAKFRKKMRETTDTSTWETEYQRCYSRCSTAPPSGRK